MRITQLQDGTYVKLLDPAEIALLNRVNAERQERITGDTALGNALGALSTQVTQVQHDLVDTGAAVVGVAGQVSQVTERVESLESTVSGQNPGASCYTKSETDALLIPWRLEEIAHQYEVPTNEFFDQTPLDGLKVGYAHFLNGRIKERPALFFPPFSMRRYTMNLYFTSPQTITFPILHDDHCVVYLNGVRQAIYEGANFAGAPDECVLTFPAGWSTLQFLVANEHYGGGLDIGVDLALKAQAMHSLYPVAGLFHGARIIPGTVVPEHLLQTEIYRMAGLLLTSLAGPALTIGTNVYGSMKLGDCRLTKQDDDLLVIDRGLRILGPLEVEDTNIVSDRRTSFLWEAEELGSLPGYQVDDPSAWNGRAWRVDSSVPAGTPVLQGPNARVRYGRYRATYRLKVGSETPGEVVTLEAFVNGVGTLGSRVLTRGELPQSNVYRNYSLTFEYDQPGDPETGGLELRALTAGNHQITLDYVALQLTGS